MPAKLSQKILKKIKEERLVKKHTHVMVGVSGGADSVALLKLLDELKHYWGLKLSVAHFDHNLRKTSQRDRDFVEKLSGQLHLPFQSAPWPKSKQSKKGSLEQNARVARYRFFKDALQKAGADCLALAHTQDDQAETVLMRFIKGSGMTGYQGILTDRRIDEMRVIRPLLDTRKTELLSYLMKKNQPFIEDPSNKDLSITRNLIRKRILPELSALLNPQLTETLARTANILQKDYVYLEKQAQRKFHLCAQIKSKTICFDLKKYKAADPALQRMMVRLACQHLTGSTRALTFQHIQEVEDLIKTRPLGSEIHLPKNINITKNSNSLMVSLR